MKADWAKEFPTAITVCDKDGIILEMNDKAAATFEKDGGYGLIGKNLFECHNQNSHDKIKEILKEEKINVYTIEKNGKKKLIYQSPWFDGGELKGLVEFSMEIPVEMPHFVRS
jgi:transcriptional regulator with PAS, ATPase and Fis domain